MAFLVEDGTGLSGSTSYASLDFADTYHEDRGNTKWTGTDAQKQAALIRASDYIDKRFGTRWRGSRKIREQAMDWPRIGAIDDDGFPIDGDQAIPGNLKEATCEYALRALLLGELAPDIPPPFPGQNNASGSEVASSGPSGPISGIREKIGELEEETNYQTGSDSGYVKNRTAASDLLSVGSIPEYPAADLLIQPLIRKFSSRRISRG